MDSLQTFLNKFKKFTVPHQRERELVAKLCTSLIKQEVPLSEIRITGSCIYINLPPLLKGEVVMRKKEFLDKINKDLSLKEPLTDLR